MLVSLNWVGDYVKLPSTLDPEQIAVDLTMTTVEVEKVIDLAAELKGIQVAVIETVKPHPDADRLKVCQCHFGDERSQVVCGGSNVEVGMLVAVARPGAVVKNGDSSLEMKVTVIRGVESYGMICSAGELGLEDLFPPADDHAIIDLSGLAVEAGQPLAQALGYDDVVLEIDNKSLTNRPDLWGHYGIARELAAIYRCELQTLVSFARPASEGDLSVSIEDPAQCRRYTATRIEGVRVTDAPFWIRSRLARVGQRPINLLVDLTNYVMLATGQPTHAFDARQLSGTLHIRSGRDAETLTLLDGSEITVDSDMLAITDGTGCLALAGVMGGDRSGIADDTTQMVLEAANFEPQGVRRSSGRSGTRTESSTRFEKGLDPLLIDQALGLFIDLLEGIQPESAPVAHIDVFPTKPGAVKVITTVDFICRRLGTDLPSGQIIGLLESLGFGVLEAGGCLTVDVPSWRATGDVDLPEDIVEEVARLYGYEKLAFVAPRVELTASVNQPKHRLERRIREALAFSCGLQEVVSYPWVDDKFLAAAGMSDSPTVSLATPPSPDSARLRPSLVPQLLKAVSSNLRYSRSFGIFEVASTYHPQSGEADGERLPRQVKRVAGALVGPDAAVLFLAAKGILETLSRTAQMQPLSLVRGGAPPWANPSGNLRIVAGAADVGAVAVVSAKAKRLGAIRLAEVVLFELELDALEALASRDNTFSPLPEFPQVEFDVSFVVDLGVVWADVLKAVDEAHALVRDVTFIEEYRGEQVPPGKKSVTLRLRIGSDSATLKTPQIDEASGSVMARLEGLGAEIRRE